VGERPDVVVRPIGKKPIVRQIFAATLANGYRSAALEEMLSILKETAREYTRPEISAVA
jgi:hypothetical protein